ncbi:hypothetical protein [Streptomyces sp. NPDC000618]|uniref:hypothetical protein n=1 Tax=Streptomyces sp. NPDC000618 TaxID=3154265 RepID=UPI00331E8879
MSAVPCRWLGTDTPFHEADVREVARFGSGRGGRRVAAFLNARGLLIPLARIDPEQSAVERLLDTVPEHLQEEVAVWVRVHRGDGRRPSPTMDWAAIRRYANYHAPALQQWGQRVESLREITPKDVEDAVHAYTGNRSHGRSVSANYVRSALRRNPSDRLAGLLDRAPTAMAVVALVAIHALKPTEIRRLLPTDLDRSAGCLVIHRRYDKRIVQLDELSMKLLTEWLRERSERWARSVDPHLFVTQITALDPGGPEVATYGLQSIFTELGLQPQKLTIDRLLDEAHEIADPVHLMRVFGIADPTAMRYVQAAHPYRFAKDPTRA